MIKFIAIESKGEIHYYSSSVNYFIGFKKHFNSDLKPIYTMFIEFQNYTNLINNELSEEEYKIFIETYIDFLNNSSKAIFNINDVLFLIKNKSGDIKNEV